MSDPITDSPQKEPGRVKAVVGWLLRTLLVGGSEVLLAGALGEADDQHTHEDQREREHQAHGQASSSTA